MELRMKDADKPMDLLIGGSSQLVESDVVRKELLFPDDV